MSQMGKQGVFRVEAALIALGAGILAACAGSPFVRPSAHGQPTIVNEATGRTYHDCRKALEEARSETVLTFSAGLFRCGPTLTAQPSWLVLRGAGMGETFLDAALPGGKDSQSDLTSIRVLHSLRVQDLSFGGLSSVEGPDAHAALVRVGIANRRPALIGGPGAHIDGGVIIIHSVLGGWLDQRPVPPAPEPIALAGNDKVAVVESVLIDVEQEFERYPAPGSIVLLSKGVDGPFGRHEPGRNDRPDPSPRPNVPCGNERNPAVFCVAQGQHPSDKDLLSKAARLLAKGDRLSQVERLMRGLGKGFAQRFRTTLGSWIRQPDVYWFADGDAKTLQAEASATPAESLKLLARHQLAVLVARCRNATDAGGSQILESAAALDKVLKASTAEDACRKQLKAQTTGLAEQCKTAWDWDRVLADVSNQDSALGLNGQMVKDCRQTLSARLPKFSIRGPLVDAYVRGIASQLQLDFDGESQQGPDFSLVGVVGQLPGIVTKSERPAFNTPKADILDRVIAMAQMPGAGDGRKLVETTDPCKPSGGMEAVRADTVVTLGELPPHARPSDTPRTVFELPVEATRDDIPSDTPEGNISVALTKRCDDMASLAYRTAVRRYVIQELTRLSDEGTDDGRLEAEAGLQLIRAEHAEEVVLQSHRLPTVTSILTHLSDLIMNEPLEAAPIAHGYHLVQSTDLSDPGELPPPPEWRVADYVAAADILARAHVVSAVACKTLLPDVPWQTDGTGIRGDIVLQAVAVELHCEPGRREFTLSLVAPRHRLPGRVLSELRELLSRKLGAPRSERRTDGPASVWTPSKGRRSGFVLRHVRKAGHVFSSIVVPIGSAWTR